jgi:hypothetical protein
MVGGNSRLQTSQASSAAAKGGQRAVQCLAQETPRWAWADHAHMMTMAWLRQRQASLLVAWWSLRRLRHSFFSFSDGQ